MIVEETGIAGAVIIDLDRKEDDRGFFARTWDVEEFADLGLNPRLVQCNLSFNHKRGTLRGMHYQVSPHEEAKLVRCTQGAIFDVIVDVRAGSSTFLRWIGVELTAENRRALYVPEGFAHGYQTLQDDTEAFYQVTEFYTPEAERGARYNDPAFGIEWPLGEPAVISDKDAEWPDFAAGGST